MSLHCFKNVNSTQWLMRSCGRGGRGFEILAIVDGQVLLYKQYTSFSLVVFLILRNWLLNNSKTGKVRKRFV